MQVQPGRLAQVAAALTLTGALAIAVQPGASSVFAKTKTTQPLRPSGPPPGSGVVGTLTSASGNTLKISVMPSRHSATVIVTSATKYMVNGKSTSTRPSWKKGEQIGFTGTKSKSGVYTAKVITLGGRTVRRTRRARRPGGRPPAGGTPPVQGRIAMVSLSVLVIKTSGGLTTFKLTGSTHYLVNGKLSSSHPALTVGEQVGVMATKSGSSKTAQTVLIGKMPAPPSSSTPPGR